MMTRCLKSARLPQHPQAGSAACTKKRHEASTSLLQDRPYAPARATQTETVIL